MKTLKFHPLSFQFTSRYITLNSQHNGESYFLLNCDSLRFRLHVHEFDLVKNNFEAIDSSSEKELYLKILKLSYFLK